VPVLVGTNRDENKLFMFASPQWVKRWFWVIPRLREPERYDAVGEHMARMWKATGADEIADAMVRSGASDVFVYRFDWDEEPTIVGAELGRMLGAAHGFEIPFVFGHWDLGSQTKLLFSAANAPGRLTLSKQMMRYWAAFARNGNPNGTEPGAPPPWQPFETPEGRFLVLDTEAGGGVRMERGHIMAEQALAEVEADPVLATPKAKCDVYRHFVRWARQPTRAEYPRMAGGACGEFPLPDDG